LLQDATVLIAIWNLLFKIWIGTWNLFFRSLSTKKPVPLPTPGGGAGVSDLADVQAAERRLGGRGELAVAVRFEQLNAGCSIDSNATRFSPPCFFFRAKHSGKPAVH
jgi:hypothetical protein